MEASSRKRDAIRSKDALSTPRKRSQTEISLENEISSHISPFPPIHESFDKADSTHPNARDEREREPRIGDG